MFRAEPDPWQAESLNALARGENASTRSGHGVGKTAALAWTVLWFLATRPYCKIPCTAPTQHQLHDLLWAEISLWLGRSPILSKIVNWTATRVGIVGAEETWFAVARSCAKPENLAGFHADHLLYVVDEASGVPDEIMATVDGALTGENSQIIMAGNPTRLSGYFYDSHHKARSLWHTIHVSSENSPRVTEKYAAEMATKWGRDSDVYRVRVLGDFPSAESNSFIPLDIVEAAAARWHDGSEQDGVRELGVDVARFGDDKTVFALRCGSRVEKLVGYHGLPTTETAGIAWRMAIDNRVTAIKVDDTGVGGGVTDILQDNSSQMLSDIAIIPCNFGGEGDEYYHNSSGVWWGALKDMLLRGELEIPDNEDLIAQLSTRHYSMTVKGKIALERKEDMKKRGLPSPDEADAVALAFAQGGDPAGLTFRGAGVTRDSYKDW
jgi:hypothetical protein